MQNFFWHLELTSKCYLKCSKCPRTNKLLNDKWSENELDIEFIKKTFTPDYIKNYMKRIVFCGCLGDPIYCNDFIKIIKYFKEIKNDLTIVVVTNGSYKKSSWWIEVASILNVYDIFIFSIDGWDDKSNNLYRVNSNYNSILKGLDIITNSSIYTIWSTILFKFNYDKIDKIEQIAKDHNIQLFETNVSTQFGEGYSDTDLVKELGYDPLQPPIKLFKDRNRKFLKMLNKNIHQTKEVEKFRSDYDEYSKKEYHKIKQQTINNYIFPLCEAGNRGMFINSHGQLYPCAWMSYPFINKTNRWEDTIFNKSKDKFNLNKYSIQEIFKSVEWKIIEDSWKNPMDCFNECESKCLRSDITYNDIDKSNFNKMELKKNE